MLGKLARQTAVYGISTVAVRFLNYLLVPFFTRIMTQAEYGVITDMYALIPFALVVLTLGMESGYFRFAGKARGGEEKRRVFASAWGAVCAAAAAFLLLALVFRNPLAGLMDYAAHPSYVSIVAGIIFFDTVTAIPFARLREQDRAGRYVFVRTVSVALNILFCVLFYAALPWLASKGVLSGLWNPDYGAGYAFVANLIASAATLLLLVPSLGGVRPRIEWRTVRPILLYSLPLLLSGIAGTANEFIDRQMIKYLAPPETAMEQLGVYGAVVKIGVVMLLFTQMYRLAAEPFFLASFRKEDFRTANAEAMKYFIMVSVLIFLVIALYADLFALIVGRDFRGGIFILPAVLLSNMLSGVVLNLSFWYKQTGATVYALVVTCTGLAFTVAFNIMLVPRLGYFGAALARLACEAAMVAVSWRLSRKHYPIPYDMRRIALYLLAGGALYGASLTLVRLPAVLRYALDAALIGMYVLLAVRREHLNLRAMVGSILKSRKT